MESQKKSPEDKEATVGTQGSKQQFRQKLNQLEAIIEELRIQYEQYFVGVLPQPPEKMHKDTQRFIRQLMKAPFKNSEISFRLRALERRFQTYNTYWERVKKQREEGTYSRDIFKAQLREKHAQEDAAARSGKGAANKNMKDLYQSYKSALEKQTGRVQKIDFDVFQKKMMQRAKEFKKQSGAKKLSFKVVVKNGKVTLKASGR